jgi:hypothetical protein
VARPDLSNIDETLQTLGPLPKELDRQLTELLGSARIDVRRADELLASLGAASARQAVQEPDEDNDEAFLIDIDPDDDD